MNDEGGAMPMKKTLFTPIGMSYLGVLIALQIVLGNLVQVALVEKQMNFGFLPIAAAGYLLGPLGGMIVAALGDILGTLIFGTGAYFPGFTLTALIVGGLYGLALYPRYMRHLGNLISNTYARLAVRALLASAMGAAVYVFLNSYWLTFLVPKGYTVLLLARLPFNLAEIPVFTVLITLTCIILDRLPPTLIPVALRAESGK